MSFKEKFTSRAAHIVMIDGAAYAAKLSGVPTLHAVGTAIGATSIAIGVDKYLLNGGSNKEEGDDV